jgi:hypothetical protein
MISNRLLAVTLGLAFAAGAASASPGEYEREDYYEQRGPMPFEVLDLNRDGVVTSEEHARVRSERHAVREQHGYPMRRADSAPDFEQIDVDGDGSISRDELSRAQAQRIQQRDTGRRGRWVE